MQALVFQCKFIQFDDRFCALFQCLSRLSSQATKKRKIENRFVHIVLDIYRDWCTIHVCGSKYHVQYARFHSFRWIKWNWQKNGLEKIAWLHLAVGCHRTECWSYDIAKILFPRFSIKFCFRTRFEFPPIKQNTRRMTKMQFFAFSPTMFRVATSTKEPY